MITGGAGLIGRAYIDSIAECEGDDYDAAVRVLDLRAHEVGRRPWLELIEGDLLDPKVRREALKNVEVVVHLAAVSRVQDAEDDPGRAEATNVGGTAALLEDAAAAPRPPSIIHASSREVYGEDRTRRLPEDAPLRPINVYGKTKLRAETAVRGYPARAKAPAVILRFANVYGTTHDQPRRVIPTFVRRSLAGEPLELHDASKTFDFVHTDDAAQALGAAIGWASEAPDPRIGVWNVATGTPTTLRALAAVIQKAAHSTAPIRETTARDFDVRYFVGDPTLAHKELGFDARVDLKAGIRRTVNEFGNAATNAKAPA